MTTLHLAEGHGQLTLVEPTVEGWRSARLIGVMNAPIDPPVVGHAVGDIRWCLDVGPAGHQFTCI